MSGLPIACSLSASDLAAVKDRYRAAAGLYQATARISDNHADIALVGDNAPLRALLDEMVERESACCSFLRFDVTETTDGFNVRLSVIEAAGTESDILRESVAAFFPGAVGRSIPARLRPDQSDAERSDDPGAPPVLDGIV